MERRAGLRRQLRTALESHQEVVFAYLYGSFLDEALPYHDVDVAVYVDPNWASGQDLFEYEMTLSVDLTLALHVPADVHVLTEAPLGFQHNVLYRGEVLFSRDDERLTDLIEQVGLQYMEFSYYVREYLQEVTS
ncbi:MAG TPA: nucleotidyltransferase domain-containing protein [Anaerolineae bacterium]|nr:nucleotidyltransferase domain-containing protein [Anaerolineae bacterium]